MGFGPAGLGNWLPVQVKFVWRALEFSCLRLGVKFVHRMWNACGGDVLYALETLWKTLWHITCDWSFSYKSVAKPCGQETLRKPLETAILGTLCGVGGRNCWLKQWPGLCVIWSSCKDCSSRRNSYWERFMWALKCPGCWGVGAFRWGTRVWWWWDQWWWSCLCWWHWMVFMLIVSGPLNQVQKQLTSFECLVHVFRMTFLWTTQFSDQIFLTCTYRNLVALNNNLPELHLVDSNEN